MLFEGEMQVIYGCEWAYKCAQILGSWEIESAIWFVK